MFICIACRCGKVTTYIESLAPTRDRCSECRADLDIPRELDMAPPHGGFTEEDFASMGVMHAYFRRDLVRHQADPNRKSVGFFTVLGASAAAIIVVGFAVFDVVRWPAVAAAAAVMTLFFGLGLLTAREVKAARVALEPAEDECRRAIESYDLWHPQVNATLASLDRNGKLMDEISRLVEEFTRRRPDGMFAICQLEYWLK